MNIDDGTTFVEQKRDHAVTTFLIEIMKRIGYALATLIILAAILVTTTRLLTPIFDDHRHDFEEWTAKMLHTPVNIKSVDVSWYQYQPEINLNHVIVLDEKHNPILEVNKIRVFVSVPQSIWQRKVVLSGLLISGAKLHLHENAQGQVAMQGFPMMGGFANQPYKSETKFAYVLAWVSQQPRLILQNIALSYVNNSGQKHLFTLYNLSFENDGNEHDILGKALLKQDIPTEINIAAKWYGQTVDLAQMKAKVYLYVSGLSLPQFLQGQVWNGWQIKSGIISTKIWATWNHNTFQKFQSDFQAYGLNLQTEDHKVTKRINRFSGNFGWKRQNESQIFAGNDILIDFPDHYWPVTRFYVSLMRDENGNFIPKTANFGYLNLNDVTSLLRATFNNPISIDKSTSAQLNVFKEIANSLRSRIPFIPIRKVGELIAANAADRFDIKKVFMDLHLQGDIENTVIGFATPWTDWEHATVSATFKNLSFSSWQQLPGMQNLSGTIVADGNTGSLVLNSHAVALADRTLFNDILHFNQVSGVINWQQKDDAWTLNIPSFLLANNDLNLSTHGSIAMFPGKPILSDIKTTFSVNKVGHISHYLPSMVLSPDLDKWLKSAFLAGEIQSGQVVLKGPMSAFPFDNNNGIFSVSGKLSGVDFRFAPTWPIIRQATGNIAFIKRKMLVDLEHSTIANIPLGSVHGQLYHLGDEQASVLYLQDNKIETNFSDAFKFIHNSPLNESLGKSFKNITLNGPLQLQLGLTVPISEPAETKVNGKMSVVDGNLKLNETAVNLNHINGQFQFTGDSIKANSVKAQLFSQPLQFNLATITDKKIGNFIQADFATNIAINDLKNVFPNPAFDGLTGMTRLNGTIQLAAEKPTIIRFRSDLQGLGIDLPNIYSKKPIIKAPLSTDVIIKDDQALQVKLNYNNQLNAGFLLSDKNTQFTLVGADVHFNNNLPNTTLQSGISLEGHFAQLNFDTLKAYFDQYNHDSNTTTPIRSVNISADQVSIAGQQLTDARLQVAAKNNHYQIYIASPEAVGQIDVPQKITRDGHIVAKFQYLNIHSTPTHQKMSPIDVLTLPAITLTANNIIYNDMPIGRFFLDTKPAKEGLSIQLLQLRSPKMYFAADGNWLKYKNGNVTHIRGNVSSPNISDLLNNFGVDAHNFVSSNGRIDFNFYWYDVPYSPSINSLNGSATINLGKGRIVDVGEGNEAKMDIGRMLSVFSLQSIPRRLSLDFSDFFQKGYSFDSIKGDFRLIKGTAYTNDLTFSGPMAQIAIRGNIGFKTKTFNVTLSVTPYVTSTLPIAATLLTGQPWIGLAVLAMNSVISKVTTYHYSVTGPWKNPSWNSVSTLNLAQAIKYD